MRYLVGLDFRKIVISSIIPVIFILLYFSIKHVHRDGNSCGQEGPIYIKF